MKTKYFLFHLIVLFTSSTLIFAQDKSLTIDLDKIPTEEIQPIRVIDENGEPLFSTFCTAAYDSFEKKIYIGNESEIIVLNLDGQVIKKIGRRGQGPGEFGNIVDIALNNQYIFVADFSNARVHVFKKDFSYFRSVPINGSIEKVIHFRNNEFIVHTTSSIGNILHKYDLNLPYRPENSFLEVLPKFEAFPGNTRGINAVNIASNAECIFVQYRSLPLLKVFCNDFSQPIERRFVGKPIEALYLIPSSVKSTNDAAPVKVLNMNIFVDQNGFLYWLCAIKNHKKLFVFDSLFQNRKALLLQLPENIEQLEKEKVYMDFFLIGKTAYILNAASGIIQVYDLMLKFNTRGKARWCCD